MLGNRRCFFTHLGSGCAGIALASMLHRDAAAKGGAAKGPHFAPKAKRVIWLFMNGGVSHVESFDPKPMLNKYAGKTIAGNALRGDAGSQTTGDRETGGARR